MARDLTKSSVSCLASGVTCRGLASSFNLAAAEGYADLAIASDELRGQVQVYRTRPALL